MSPPEIKFCGLTRSEDAAAVQPVGAQYGGVILAGGPRNVTLDVAASVLGALGPGVRPVAVLGKAFSATLRELAARVPVAVAQLHADPDPDDVDAARRAFTGEVWAVVRIPDDSLPPGAAELFRAADGVVLDAGRPGALGGTGKAWRWERVATQLSAVRGSSRLVVAGGLRPENVAEAVAVLAPDVVDVSSGVETSPGLKDHGRMAQFVLNARGASR